MASTGLRLAGLLALVAALSGCGTGAPPEGLEMSPARWREEVTRRGVDPDAAPYPMAATPEMKAAARALAGSGQDEERLERLQAALSDRNVFAFEYEKTSTFTAPEAFEARRGNCVSFTNLFIAMGRSLGIRLSAALVYSRGESEKRGDMIVTYSHMVAFYAQKGGATAIVYDFSHAVEQPGRRLVSLDDPTVAAIRESNAGVAHLSAGDVEGANRDMELAARLGPGLASLHANLGLVRWRRGDVPGAFAAYRRGLEVEPNSPSVLQNLAALYIDQDRPAEARTALAAIDVSRASPYALIVRGDLALTRGNVKDALRNYRQAASLGPKLAEPYLAIARAERVRGRPDAARKALEKALKRDPENAEAKRLLDWVP